MRWVVLWLGVFFFSCSACAQEAWNDSKSTHFVVLYHTAPRDFVERVTDEAERLYGFITDKLGFLRYNFWIWDDRAKIYIYDSAQQYQEVTHMPAWACGNADWQNKAVSTFYGAEGFFDNLLPHELSHIIFREFVGFDNPAVPGWLDEGVAQYLETRGRAADAFSLLARSSDTVPPLGQLARIDLRGVADTAEVTRYYALAAAVVEYLVESGKDSFVIFCRSLRDTRDLDASLSYAYSINGVADLDQRLRVYLKH